jgi:phage shock protein A
MAISWDGDWEEAAPAGDAELRDVLEQWCRLRERVHEMRTSLLAAERTQTRDDGRSPDARTTELAAQLAAERARFDALARQIDERIEEARGMCAALKRQYAAMRVEERGR